MKNIKNLVILAHPYSKSFGAAIANTIIEETKNNGGEVVVRDLNELNFNPVLSATDLVNVRTRDYAEDIKIEQEYITWADIITVVYPTWWGGMPAILKGYFDRVFANGFAYNNEGGLLSDKKALLFTTTGTPSDIYKEAGMHDSMKQIAEKGIFNAGGVKVLNHTFFGAVPTSSEEVLKQYLEDTKRIIKELFV